MSGDFYWISEKGTKIIIAVADCTGHGVPGAFMSMLGISYLNEIMNLDGDISPATILGKLRDHVIRSLHQTGRLGESQDGMDMALIIIDRETRKIEFSGANLPLIIFKDGEMVHVPGDKMPIGIHESNITPFSVKKFSLEKGDVIYAFSDGYPDQFGGPRNKKFMMKGLRKLLAGISMLPMDQQKRLVEKNFLSWKGNIPQVDDVLLVGIRVN